MGKPSKKRAWNAYGSRINPGSTLIHDKEKSHSILVKNLELKEQVYYGNDLKKMDDKDNPMNPINN